MAEHLDDAGQPIDRTPIWTDGFRIHQVPKQERKPIIREVNKGGTALKGNIALVVIGIVIVAFGIIRLIFEMSLRGIGSLFIGMVIFAWVWWTDRKASGENWPKLRAVCLAHGRCPVCAYHLGVGVSATCAECGHTWNTAPHQPQA